MSYTCIFLEFIVKFGHIPLKRAAITGSLYSECRVIATVKLEHVNYYTARLAWVIVHVKCNTEYGHILPENHGKNHD